MKLQCIGLIWAPPIISPRQPALSTSFQADVPVGESAAELSTRALAEMDAVAEALREVLPVERRHTELAEEGLERLTAEGQGAAIADSLSYWRPRVAAVFGDPSEERMAQLQAWGLRHASAPEMRAEWEKRLDAALTRLGLTETA